MEVLRSDQDAASPGQRSLIAKRLAVSITAIVALVTVVVLWVQPSSHPAPRPLGVIAWQDPPVAPDAVRFTQAPDRPAAPECVSTSLTSLPPAGSFVLAQRDLPHEVLVINRGDEACSITGPPHVVAIGPSGVTPIAYAGGETDGVRTLGRDEGTGLMLSFARRASCVEADSVVNIAIEWPDGARIPIADGFTELGCLTMILSAWRPVFLAGAIHGLNARIIAPTSVRANATFAYTVVLSNPGSAEVRLDPCPTFAQGFGTAERRQLPCPVAVMAAGQNLSYEMRILATPQRLQNSGSGGTEVLRWELNDRLGETIAFATADITVVA